MRDVENLLAPVSDDQPAGPDMSASNERMAIEAPFERSFDGGGDEEANWSAVIRDITAQLGETKDIWLPVYMMRAGALAGRLAVVADGAALLARMVERYWDNMHPDLEEWGLQSRITPCHALSRVAEFLGPLRRTVLVEHPRLGAYSGADFERFEQNGDAEPDFGNFLRAMNDIEPELLTDALAMLESIKADLKLADTLFMEKCGGQGPNFQTTYETLDALRRSVASYAGADATAEELAAQAETEAGESESAARGPAYGGLSGRVESRDDVLKAFDAIADYYRRKEPSSPIPVALQRARQWVTLDFLAILDDIAPNSIDDAKRVLVFGRE